MVKREFSFHGKSLDELKSMSLSEFAALLPSRQRRCINRGFTDAEKILLANLKKDGANLKTHCRDMIIIPEMVNKIIKVHDGKNYIAITILPQMLGHCLGEFALTRKRITHSAPGIGATRSSASLSVK